MIPAFTFQEMIARKSNFRIFVNKSLAFVIKMRNANQLVEMPFVAEMVAVFFCSVFLNINFMKEELADNALLDMHVLQVHALLQLLLVLAKILSISFLLGWNSFQIFLIISQFQLGIHTRYGDTSQGVNEVAPTCNYLSEGD